MQTVFPPSRLKKKCEKCLEIMEGNQTITIQDDDSIDTEELNVDVFIPGIEKDVLVVRWPRVPLRHQRQCFIHNGNGERCKVSKMLDDELLDFGVLHHLYSGANSIENQGKIFFMNPQFWAKLQEGKNEKERYRLAHVLIHKVKIFEKDFLLIPINIPGIHWYLVCYVKPVYILQGKELAEEDEDDNGLFPCILVMDSMSKSSIKQYDEVLNTINDFLVLQYLTDHYLMVDWCCGLMSEDKLKTRMNGMRKLIVHSPQQPSIDVSCGMYVIRNSKHFIDRTPRISENMLKNLERRGFVDLNYEYNDIKKDRKDLFRTILSVIQENKNYDSPEYSSAEVLEEISNAYFDEIYSPVFADVHKKERRTFPSKSIGGFVDLSESPLKTNELSVTRVESTKITTDMLSSNTGRRRKLSQVTSIQAKQTKKDLRKASDIEKNQKQEEFEDYECNNIKYVDMKGIF
jgi:hypothetical protein